MNPEHSPLGKATVYATQYDASLLFPIPRAGAREQLGITSALPFFGTVPVASLSAFAASTSVSALRDGSGCAIATSRSLERLAPPGSARTVRCTFIGVVAIRAPPFEAISSG